MDKPTSGMWSSSYTYDWIIWCGWRIRQEGFTDVRQALHKIMRETKGTVNPKWISGWFCPACDGTKIFDDEPCLNCNGKGIFDEYMNKPLVKPKRNKVELELDWQDVRKAVEGGNKAFEKWLEEKQNE